MPTIYEYLGLIFLFHLRGEHYPIHVHVKYGNYHTVFELYTKNGEVIDIQRRRKYSNELPPSQLKLAEEFVWARKEQIVKKWEQVLVERRKIKSEKITRRIYK